MRVTVHYVYFTIIQSSQTVQTLHNVIDSVFCGILWLVVSRTVIITNTCIFNHYRFITPLQTLSIHYSTLSKKKPSHSHQHLQPFSFLPHPWHLLPAMLYLHLHRKGQLDRLNLYFVVVSQVECIRHDSTSLNN